MDQFAERVRNLWPIHLLQNDVVFINYAYGYWREKWSSLKPERYSYDQIMKFSDSELRTLCKKAVMIIVGGMGFTGYDPLWNASSGIYNGTVSPEEDIRETVIFESLYDRMAKIAGDMSVIVLTHTPKHCWSKKPYVKGWIYINGHTHHNSCSEVDGARIYSDNQIGYYRDLKSIKFKSIPYDCSHDIFEHFSDGVHRITDREFIEFHHSKAINCSLAREGTIYMLKNAGYYMFIFRNKEGKLLFMKSGQLSKLGNKNIDYYLQMMPRYVECIRRFLKPYTEYQQSISKVVKGFGGDGKIHGCIVDINYYNHLYVNPFDGTVTPYYAEDKEKKWVYPSVRSLLKDKAPYLFSRVDESYSDQKAGASESDSQDISKALLNPADDDTAGTEITYVADQEIYNYSILIYEFQRMEFNHIVRFWDERLLVSDSLPVGKSLSRFGSLATTCIRDKSAVGPLVEYLALQSIQFLDGYKDVLRSIGFFSDVGTKKNLEYSSDSILYVMDCCFHFYNFSIDMPVAKELIKDLKNKGPSYLPLDDGLNDTKGFAKDALIIRGHESFVDSIFSYHAKVFRLLILYHINRQDSDGFLDLYSSVCTSIVNDQTIPQDFLASDGLRELLTSRMSSHIEQIRKSMDDINADGPKQIGKFKWGNYKKMAFRNTVSKLNEVLDRASDPDNHGDITLRIIRSFLTVFLPSYEESYSKSLLEDRQFLIACVRMDL